MTEIRVVAELNLTPEQKEKLLPSFKKLVDASRAEPGNISYELTEDMNDPNRLCFLEIWKSREALDAHAASPHFKEFAELAMGMKPKIAFLKKVY